MSAHKCPYVPQGKVGLRPTLPRHLYIADQKWNLSSVHFFQLVQHLFCICLDVTLGGSNLRVAQVHLGNPDVPGLFVDLRGFSHSEVMSLHLHILRQMLSTEFLGSSHPFVRWVFADSWLKYRAIKVAWVLLCSLILESVYVKIKHGLSGCRLHQYSTGSGLLTYQFE